MLKRFSSDKRGASALEFAIVAPVFLLFLLGMFYVSWTIYNITSARFAIAEAGRALQMNQKLTAAELDAIFRKKIQTGLMTIQNLTLAVSASQAGFSIAKIKAPILIKLKIPFMTEISLDFSVSTEVALVPA
jgi:Flp pilus assembly protein TadG